jgi:MFS family permease
LIFYLTLKTKNVYIIILIYSLGILATNFAGPSWTSWMNDIVPVKLRGEFWGSRNRILGIFQFLGIIIAGLSLYFLKEMKKELLAFGILFTTAFLFRFSSIYPLNKQFAPEMQVPAKSEIFKFKVFLTKLTTTNFGKFSIFCFLMTFSVNFMAPLIPIFILKYLGFNYIQFTVIIMLSLILSYTFMTYWGPLSDKYGNYRILFITAISLPIVSLLWVFIRDFYLLCILQILSGFVWAGFNLSMTNFIYDAVRKENISKIMAYFNSLNNFFAFSGSISCGITANFIDSKFNIDNIFINKFIFIFSASTVLRIVTIFIFSRQFKEVRSVEPSPPIRFFYIFKPLNDFMNTVQIIGYNIKKQFKK